MYRKPFESEERARYSSGVVADCCMVFVLYKLGSHHVTILAPRKGKILPKATSWWNNACSQHSRIIYFPSRGMSPTPDVLESKAPVSNQQVLQENMDSASKRITKIAGVIALTLGAFVGGRYSDADKEKNLGTTKTEEVKTSQQPELPGKTQSSGNEAAENLVRPYSKITGTSIGTGTVNPFDPRLNSRGSGATVDQVPNDSTMRLIQHRNAIRPGITDVTNPANPTVPGSLSPANLGIPPRE